MLVLSRKEQQSVVIADGEGHECLIQITVVAIKGGKVRLGFAARRDLPVHRMEVWEQIRAGTRSRRDSVPLAR